MKLFQSTILAIAAMATFTTATAQSNKKVTKTVAINGNCGMCKKTIETAANSKDVKLVWSPESKTATLTYNPSKTNVDNVLKRVADAGYDNESYEAKEEVYKKLHGCCQYDRSLKATK
nr:copper chaperone [uncultured Flavobacterium sp.]